MSERSVLIRERLFEVIHHGEIENPDLVKIVEHIANDILNCKTKANYPKGKISKITNKEPSYHLWKWSHKETFKIDGKLFIVDNE
jgi:hypothetical protein